MYCHAFNHSWPNIFLYSHNNISDQKLHQLHTHTHTHRAWNCNRAYLCEKHYSSELLLGRFGQMKDEKVCVWHGSIAQLFSGIFFSAALESTDKSWSVESFSEYLLQFCLCHTTKPKYSASSLRKCLKSPKRKKEERERERDAFVRGFITLLFISHMRSY